MIDSCMYNRQCLIWVGTANPKNCATEPIKCNIWTFTWAMGRCVPNLTVNCSLPRPKGRLSWHHLPMCQCKLTFCNFVMVPAIAFSWFSFLLVLGLMHWTGEHLVLYISQTISLKKSIHSLQDLLGHHVGDPYLLALRFRAPFTLFWSWSTLMATLA